MFLNEDQSEQMKNIMETVEKNFSDDLDNVLKESETHFDFFARNVAKRPYQKQSTIESGPAQE